MPRILFITTPGCCRKQPDVHCSDWCAVWLTALEAKTFLDQETAGLFFKEWPTKDEFAAGTEANDWVPVLLQETLLMAIRWSRAVELRILSFQHFLPIALMGDGRVLEDYGRGFDIVFGGCEYTVDQVEAGHFKNREQESIYIDRLDSLGRSVLVWPPPRESLFYRQKSQLIRRLDRIAKFDTFTPRPKTSILSQADHFTSSTVLKREGSDQGKHRLFYDCCDRPQETAAELVKTNSRSDADLDAGQMLWLLQDLVPELLRYGEYRVYVVAGKIVSVVGTTPGARESQWHVKDCLGVYGLSELTPQVLRNPEPHNVLIRQGGTEAVLDKAMGSLHRFVLTTHAALIREAEIQFPQRASVLRQFARIDVSFMRGAGRAYQYFVNEVEIPNGVFLFCGFSDKAERVMDELLQCLADAAGGPPGRPRKKVCR